LPGLQSTFCF